MADYFFLQRHQFGPNIAIREDLEGNAHLKVDAVVDGLSSLDAFGRQRVSDPHTLFDSKQVFDAQTLFWDDAETSGGGTGTSHSANRASSTLSVTADTAGQRVRQTYRRFNYESGKSQLVLMTFVLGDAAEGITRRVGTFDANNGLFLEQDVNGIGVARRSYVTGAAVDTLVRQSSWNLDKLDGTGESGVTLDMTKTQILVIDYEWLGVGRVRFGFNVDGVTYYCHEFLNANNLTSVYMSTPNLPLRYELTNDGTGGAATLECICASVMSEGGTNGTGKTVYISNGGTHVDCNVADTVYALVGIKLKAAYLGATVQVEDVNFLTETATAFEWSVVWNPTVAGSFSYSDVTNSAVQRAVGATANTVTGGLAVAGGYASATAQSRAAISTDIKSALTLGSSISGTADALVLCARPLANSADISGGLTVRELL